MTYLKGDSPEKLRETAGLGFQAEVLTPTAFHAEHNGALPERWEHTSTLIRFKQVGMCDEAPR